MGFRRPIRSFTDQTARDLAQQALNKANAAQQAAATAQEKASQAITLADDPLAQIPPGAIESSLLAADAIDGRTITGSTLRTAATGQRVQIDSTNGLVGYSAAGAAVTQIRPSDGSLVATNATVTGLVQTAASGPRAVLDEDTSVGQGRLRFFTDSNTTDTPPTLYGFAFTGTPTIPGHGIELYAGSLAGVAGPSIVVSNAGAVGNTPASKTITLNDADSVNIGSDLSVAGKVNGVPISDTGWRALTLATSPAWSATVAQYRVLNDVFYFSIMATSAAAWSANAALFTAPTGKAPTIRYDFLDVWATTPGYVIVQPTGAVTVAQAGAAGAGVIVSGSWPI